MTTTEKPLQKPLPDVKDPVTAPYWAAARESRLVVPRCTNCGYRLWPPERLCPECQHTEFAWEDVTPEGTLWSYATYHRALDPAFADEIPYVVGLVELDAADGVKMYGLVRAEPDEVAVGRRVRAVFEKVTDDVTMVRWRPTSGE